MAPTNPKCPFGAIDKVGNNVSEFFKVQMGGYSSWQECLFSFVCPLHILHSTGGVKHSVNNGVFIGVNPKTRSRKVCLGITVSSGSQ